MSIWLTSFLSASGRDLFHVSVNLYAHLQDDARATGLSLISAIVTVYICVGGVILGWVAERSLPVMFAALGLVIEAGAIAIRIEDAPTTETEPSPERPVQAQAAPS